MGSSSWSGDAYKNLKTDYSTKSRDQIFTNDSIDNEMSPKDVKFRESRDSTEHPQSVAIALFLDETGSMGTIPERLIKEKLGSLMETLISHGVPDAHVLFGGIGDHISDKYPLQVGQFEAGTEELNKWLTKIVLEGNGGAQQMESYSLAWFFSGRHTSIDCFEKRGEKGFLFTIGDEWVHPLLEADRLSKLMGYDFSENISAEQVLKEAQRMYHVFHLHCHQTSTGQSPDIISAWKKLMGENVIVIEDYSTIAEVIATTVAVIRGANLKDVVKDFDHHIAGHVTNALVHLGDKQLANTQTDGVRKL